MTPNERRTIDRAIARLRDAWDDAGPVPAHHHRAKAELHGTWPTLARAIEFLLVAADYSEENPMTTNVDRAADVLRAARADRVTLSPEASAHALAAAGLLTPAAPALPDGWRLADHREYGRVIVTNPTPNCYGAVYFAFPRVGYLNGFDWKFCDPDELAYLDQEADQ